MDWLAEMVETALVFFLVLVSFICFIFLVITTPIWGIPYYFIYKKVKEREKE